jgi:HD-like signal output (HDOD) protein
VRVLEQLGVPYFIVGSVASSAYGLPRATQDIDFVVALGHEQVPKLVAALESEFYVGDLLQKAVREAELDSA